MMVSYVQLEWWAVLVRLPLVAVKRLVLHVKVIKVAIVPGFHLFPFRTEKLSPAAPMVLRNSGRVGSRRLFQVKGPFPRKLGRGLLFCRYRGTGGSVCRVANIHSFFILTCDIIYTFASCFK